MKYIVSLFVFVSLLNFTTWAIYAANNTKEVIQESNILIKNIKNPTWKVWIKNAIRENINAIKAVESRHSSIPLNRLLKKELLGNINTFLSEIKNNAYTFDISESDRKEVESTILNYQKDFFSSFKTQIAQYLGKDQKQTGNMNFSIHSSETDVVFQIESYNIVASKDGKNLEMSMRFNVTVKENKTNEVSKIMIDGSIIILGEDIYISLKDYSITPPKETMVDLEMMESVLSEIKWKVYHQKADKIYGEYLVENASNNEIVIKLMNDTLDVLLTQSLLTPIAKKGNIFVLGVNSKVLRDLTHIFDSEYNQFFQSFPIDLLPGISLPWNITSDGSSIWINHLDESIRVDSKISRNTENISVINISLEEVWVKYPWKGQLTMTPENIRINGSVAEYLFDYTGNKASIYSTLKKSNKTIATLKVDTTGFNAWTYNFSGMWDYSKYNWETDLDETESIVFQFFARIQAEFGEFAILKPSITHELEKLSYFERERDKTRIRAIRNVAWNLDYYESDYNKYPKVPKNWCVHSIKTPDSSIWFGYFEAPQSLWAWTCSNGYFYRKLKDGYIVASRVEQQSAANYDNSKVDINTASYNDILANSKNAVISNNPNDWLYVMTREWLEDYYKSDASY